MIASTKRRRPNSAMARPTHGTTTLEAEIGDEQGAKQRRRKQVGRRREMEAHIGEGGDEIEQHAEADA